MTLLIPALAIAGAACAAFPIIIHLLSRRRRTPLPWAAMRFLIEAYKKQRRRLELEQLLLLALRCLILVAFGLALARPILEGAGLLGAGGSRVVYLVIDDGLASGLPDTEGVTALAHHVARAVEIVEALDPGDRVGLITASRPARDVISPPSSDHAGVIALLETLEPKTAPTDLPGALSLLDLACAPLEREREQLVACLLSDFRAGSAHLDVALPTLQALATGRVELFAFPPDPTPNPNVQVVAVEPARGLVIRDAADGSGQITVRLARSGGALERDVTRVRLLGDDVARTEPKVVEWAPGQSEQSIDFLVSFGAQRDRETGLTAEIDTSGNPADDARHTVVALRKQLRTLLIGRRSFGQAPSLERLTASQWIRRALEPDETGPVEVVEVEPAALEVSDLRGADAAILVRPDLLPPERWALLRSFIDRGGLVMIVPPGEATVHEWVDHLARDLELPWHVEREVRALAEDVPLAGEQPRSALLGMISSDLGALAQPVVVRRFLQVDDLGTGGTASLVLATGEPLLISGAPRTDESTQTSDRASAPPGGDSASAIPAAHAASTARGLVVLLTVAPELEWTNLPSKPFMVPLFHEVLRQGVGLIRAERPAGVGERPMLAVGPAASSIVAPGGARFALDRERRPERYLEMAGLYAVTDGAGQNVGTIAVNVEASSGRADPQAEAAVGAWLSKSGAWRFAKAAEPAVVVGRAEVGASLSGAILLAVLVLLFIETLLARIFSHAHRHAGEAAEGGLLPTMSERTISAGAGGAT